MRILRRKYMIIYAVLVVCVFFYELYSAQHVLFRSNAPLQVLSTNEIKQLANKLNTEQNIHNSELFRLNLNSESVVILIQVHNRVDTLRIVVQSLRNIRFLNESLVIFSHDVYSPEIFQIVQSIDFCPVMQIFYPYSIQIYPESFPGDHPNDCPRNIDGLSAENVKCNNALFPDRFEHYRNGPSCQLKHHWLWKMHFVFDRVRLLHGYEGTVLLSEDDYYLADDIIHFVTKLKQQQTTVCPTCKMYILGNYEGFSTSVFETSAQNVILDYFHTGIGRGMAISRGFWNDLKSCAKYFCTYDDYNYDFSLHNAVSTCLMGGLQEGLKVMKSVTSRVFHIGRCQGFHRSNTNCNMMDIVAKIRRFIERYKKNLFPNKISIINPSAKIRQKTLLLNYGGWADPRDHELCYCFINNVTHREQLLADIHNNLLNYAHR